MTLSIIRAMVVLAFVLAYTQATPNVYAQESIQLPEPSKSGGMPLYEALSKRHSTRSFKADELNQNQLSGILWSAFGVNRPDGKRTIPTAMGKNALQVYAVLHSGVYLYNPDSNTLTLALAGDFTKKYGDSPLTLLFAAPNEILGGFHAGSAYQSVGLYCAAEGLANVVKTSGKDELKGKLTLPSGYEVLVVQSIGLPG